MQYIPSKYEKAKSKEFYEHSHRIRQIIQGEKKKESFRTINQSLRGDSHKPLLEMTAKIQAGKVTQNVRE